MTLRAWRDVLLVARFEVGRALRTWRAGALVVVFVVANVGGAWLFIEGLAEVERTIASGMGVPAPRWPGTLAEQVRESESIRGFLRSLAGDDAGAERLVAEPLLALFALAEAMVLVPFLAATSASEALAPDVRSRAIRFEAMRTGRAELLFGRFVGQTALTTVALVAAFVGVGGVTLVRMVAQDPVALGLGLLGYGLRALAVAIPFVGFGVTCSAVTASPGWARVLALVGVAASWVLYGLSGLVEDAPWTWLADATAPLFPQAWLRGLWGGPADVATSVGMLVLLGVGALAPGLARFATRDL